MTNLEIMLQALKVLRGCLEHPDAQDAMDALTLAIEREDSTPPKEWVGLTKEEAADCWSNEAVRTWHAIEAKLKEKNI